MLRLHPFRVLGWRLLALGLPILLGGCEIDTEIIPERRCRNGQPLPVQAVLSSDCITGNDRFLTNETAFDAAVAFRGDQLLYHWGDIHRPMNTASVRKSILSALYGIAVDRGLIRLDATLAELGIDDNKQPLTPAEKQATVRQLLQSRSGIYLRSLGESGFWADRRPARGSFAPGTRWFYNNWDFNVLGVIFERQTGLTLGQAIDQWLARPLGMESFCPEHVTYDYDDYTEHPIQRIYLSAADLARFGALYVDDGRWQGQQVLPPGWVNQTFQPYSDVLAVVPGEVLENYGYLWWYDADTNTWLAVGSGGQFILVDRARNLTIVARKNTGTTGLGVVWYDITDGGEATYEQLFTLHQRIIQCLP